LNELMLREHPRGAGPLVGVQVRYLIGSAHGWLGGLGFGASALQLKDRDRWNGWDGEGRQKHLHRIVGLSRFLILPMVACHNLASRVLAMALRQFPRGMANTHQVCVMDREEDFFELFPDSRHRRVDMGKGQDYLHDPVIRVPGRPPAITP
jgi:hypothetical protein